MKKNIIALAVASAIAAPVAMADAPTVYGQINMALEQYDNSKDKTGVTYTVPGAANAVTNESTNGTQVNSRASRIGVKGSSDLGNGLKAVYKAEFEVQIDSSSTLKNRNQYVGLAGGFGTVLMGRHDTPLKMAQAKDLFNDSAVADNKPMAGGLGAFGKGGENRVSNVLAYVSPSFGGVKIVGAFVPKETSGDESTASSLTDLMSFAAMYGSKKKGLYLSAAMDMASKSFTGTSWVDADNNGFGNTGDTFAGDGEAATHLRLVAQYSVAGLMANAMYQDFSGKALDGSAKKGTNIQANIGYKMGNLMPKFKVSMVDRTEDDSATGNKYKDSTNYAVGLNYSFAKKTTGYVEYATLDNVGGKDKQDTSAFSVGMVHKF